MTEAREKAWTKGPWRTNVFVGLAGVNDGSHPDWQAPKSIPIGQCVYCSDSERTLLQSFTDEKGNWHRHISSSDDWRSVYGADGTQIVGMYDYEEGGICTSQADAHLIAAAPEMYEALEMVRKIIAGEIRPEERYITISCDERGQILEALAKARGER